MQDIKVHHQEIERLFNEESPVLVELRSPKSEVISNWYLVEASASFWALMSNCPAGAEVYLLSVKGLETVHAQVAGLKVD